ncbi:MAG: MFS transporter [Planctomycetales bacterium]|nr:MFS transporter [Planctomycetales bacterium]
MNFFDTPLRRKILFAALYLSEGAPIGFLWLALPTRLRARDVPLEQITWLTAVLVLPWTFKFAWAPLVDALQTRWWTLRHWIIAAQTLMGATLLPLIWIEPVRQFDFLASLLLTHAFAAATQDVAIDALCISATKPEERGQYNGWMQAGMLIGRATLGGGALVLGTYIGEQAVVGLLVLVTTFSMVLVILSPVPQADFDVGHRGRLDELWMAVRVAISQSNTWIGLLFGLTGGAAFKSLEVIYGPFLVDRGFDNETIGWFSLGPMIGAMVVGSVFGGWLADRAGRRSCVAGSLAFIALAVLGLAAADWLMQGEGGWYLCVLLATAAFGIGVFTASSYAMFMDVTSPRIAATQFSAFMGSTNGCESWSSYASGQIIARQSYPTAMAIMSVASLLALPLVFLLHPRRQMSPPLQLDDRSTR